ncbi:HAD family phosphatase [Bacillus mesophilus]|uniref:HAD family phosphatase n=1 Tax=Bacillus mesophilus TaxID=1808955 RepID=A0A6M0Q7W8_9BACI|nr:HAD family phosphatase [Bacillus mesophilus]
MIKCIAIDMDGTLLNNDHVVSEENAAAVLKAQSEGIEVVIATGRSYREAKYVLDEAGIRSPLISVNGAETRNVEGEAIGSNPLSRDKAQELATILHKHDAYYELYTSQGTYTKDYDKALTVIMDIFMSASIRSDYDKAIKAAKERFEKGMVHLVDDFSTLLKNEHIPLYKLIVFSFDKEKLNEVKLNLSSIQDVAITSSGKENIEINSIQAQKGIALKEFVEQNNISLKETMAIGDNYNDISMLKIAGRSVAMGNGPEEVKKHAQIITDTNHHNGVAKAILEVL